MNTMHYHPLTADSASVTLLPAQDISGVTITGLPPTTTRLIGVPICPDLLDFAALGETDNLRGRVVRAFFWLIRWWK